VFGLLSAVPFLFRWCCIFFPCWKGSSLVYLVVFAFGFPPLCCGKFFLPVAAVSGLSRLWSFFFHSLR